MLHIDFWWSHQSGISEAGCSSCVKKVITGKNKWCVGVNSSRWLTAGSWSCGLTTGTDGHWEIIYTWAPTTDSQSQRHRVMARECPEGVGAVASNVVKKLWVNIAVLCQSTSMISICLSLSLSLTLTEFQPFWEIKGHVYFYNHML